MLLYTYNPSPFRLFLLRRFSSFFFLLVEDAQVCDFFDKWLFLYDAAFSRKKGTIM